MKKTKEHAEAYKELTQKYVEFHTFSAAFCQTYGEPDPKAWKRDTSKLLAKVKFEIEKGKRKKAFGNEDDGKSIIEM